MTIVRNSLKSFSIDLSQKVEENIFDKKNFKNEKMATKFKKMIGQGKIEQKKKKKNTGQPVTYFCIFCTHFDYIISYGVHGISYFTLPSKVEISFTWKLFAGFPL